MSGIRVTAALAGAPDPRHRLLTHEQQPRVDEGQGELRGGHVEPEDGEEGRRKGKIGSEWHMSSRPSDLLSI